MKQLVLDFTPALRPTFATFVAGRNLELVKQLRHHASELVAGVNPPTIEAIYLWGEKGVGKSHLLASLANACGASASDLTTARVPRCLVVDDVEALDAAHQHALFNRFNDYTQPLRLIAVSASVAPRQLSLREDLRTRLASGLVYQIQPLADAELVDALMVHARERGFELKAEVAAFLVSRLARDMPNLVGVLDQLDRFSLAHKRAITLPLVREALAFASPADQAA
jgi:DnaA-homolog protein